MTATIQVRCSAVKVGDRITEIDTPGGPFYPVIKVNPRSFVVDAAGPMRPYGDDAADPIRAYGDDVPEAEPMRFPYSPSDVVLVVIDDS